MIGGAAISSVSNKIMAKQVYDYLTKEKGIDHAHAVGILANMQNESKFNSGIIGDGGTSGGLFQHHDNPSRGEYRFTNMRNYAGRGGQDWRTNWKGQIDYALSEGDMKKYLSRQIGRAHV